VNPYGVAAVPKGFLVSNFNNSNNLQGTGTTIVRVNNDGTTTLFFQGQQGLGLTTALGVLKKGFVLVGSLPTTDGTSATVQAPGTLLILNRFGKQVGQITNASFLDGPWDLTINDQGNKAQVFVSNVLNGTVTRLNLKVNRNSVQVQSATIIASGYNARTDPAALLIGPTGLAFDARKNVLYVASTGDNAIFAIPNAKNRQASNGPGQTIYQDNTHLHGPLGLVLLPNGDLLTANGDAVNPDDTQPSELVEFTKQGQFVAQTSISDQQGGAFGVGVTANKAAVTLAAVNDITNSLEVWRVANKKQSN
jgi:hypothetical protein